eukprot:CAMPEP_0184649758 /NCGR_PEP_ID=MMETSP0308-20130426/7174_1 /TAXON_ID=38269 /ORGANISM="Gloeochaete witrockiana, Strain SAG 46.84" /LENGTH=327 /DNA_ID=CAMNT_0027082733 /DNA_START=99 /DNA_END=1082 /DNA_ORIENTATION=-
MRQQSKRGWWSFILGVILGATLVALVSLSSKKDPVQTHVSSEDLYASQANRTVQVECKPEEPEAQFDVSAETESAVADDLDPVVGASAESPTTSVVSPAIAESPNLFTLMEKHGTDKLRHGYANAYSKYLPMFRSKKNLKILEIGLGCDMPYGPGKSIPIWREYFPEATIYVLEYMKPCALKWWEEHPELRIEKVFTGSQSDPEFVRSVLSQTGKLDIVIDDGGHRMEHQRVSMQLIFPTMNSGGVYFCEDAHTSWNTAYGGGPVSSKDTTLATVKHLINYLWFGLKDFRAGKRWVKPPKMDTYAKAVFPHLLSIDFFITMGVLVHR